MKKRLPYASPKITLILANFLFPKQILKFRQSFVKSIVGTCSIFQPVKAPQDLFLSSRGLLPTNSPFNNCREMNYKPRKITLYCVSRALLAIIYSISFNLKWYVKFHSFLALENLPFFSQT